MAKLNLKESHDFRMVSRLTLRDLESVMSMDWRPTLSKKTFCLSFFSCSKSGCALSKDLSLQYPVRDPVKLLSISELIYLIRVTILGVTRDTL